MDSCRNAKGIATSMFTTGAVGLVLLVLSSGALAAPTINSAKGKFVRGKRIIVGGKNFGAKAIAAPIKYESFEWGSVGDAIDVGNDPVEPRWQKAGAGGATIDSTRFHSGVRSAYKALTYNSNNCAFYDSYIDVPDTDEMFVSYWFYWDTADALPFSEGGAFFKLNRINGSHRAYGGTPSLLITLSPSYSIPETGYMSILNYTDDQTQTNHLNKARAPNNLVTGHGAWHRIEMWIKLSNPAGATNGEIEYAIDAIPVTFTGEWGYPWEGVTLSTGSTAKLNVFTLLFGACRLTDTSYPLLWQDDIYVDNTRARIEIGDASTWATNIHREIQIPVSWSSDSVAFTFNQGSFGDGASAYLYIVDQNGKVNETGYPITIGE